MAKSRASKSKGPGRPKAKAAPSPKSKTTAQLQAETRKREAQARLARNAAEQARVTAELKRLKASAAELRRAVADSERQLKASRGQSKAALEGIERRFILADAKARRYFDRLTGEYISRREQVRRANEGRSPEQIANDNLLKLARGRTDEEGREKIRQELDRRGRQKAFTQRFKEKKARELGVRPSDIKVRGDSDTARQFKTLSRITNERRNKVRGGKARRREVRAYVDALIDLGVIDDDDRDEWINHYVGE